MWNVGIYTLLTNDRINRFWREAAQDRLAREASAAAGATCPSRPLVDRLSVIARALLPRRPSLRAPRALLAPRPCPAVADTEIGDRR